MNVNNSNNSNDDFYLRAQYETSRRMRLTNVNAQANSLRPPKHKTSSVPYRKTNNPEQPMDDQILTPATNHVTDFKATMDEMGVARPLIGQG